MKFSTSVLIAATCVTSAYGEFFLTENFNDEVSFKNLILYDAAKDDGEDRRLFWFFQICILTYSIFFLLTYDPFEYLFCLVLFLTRDVIIIIIISSLNNDLCRRRRESELNVAFF